MSFRYELHCHSMEGSKCSKFPSAEMPAFYKGLGYDGMVITDHFAGNGVFGEETPWEERVGSYHDIYLKMKKAGDEVGISVFFGIEFTLSPIAGRIAGGTGNDFIFLNLSADWLLRNRDVFASEPKAMFTRAREAGAFVIHAHPMLIAEWVSYIRLLPRHVDAAEVFNASCSDEINLNSKTYAGMYGLPATGGSDCHSPGQRVLSGVETPDKCNAINDVIKAIRNGSAVPFRLEREL